MVFVCSSSSAHHHIIIIISSSSFHHQFHHHHHLIIIIIISPSSSSFPSLSLAFLFLSILAQPSSHEKRVRATPLRENAFGPKNAKNWGFFAIFFWSNPLRESSCRVLKTDGFLQIFLARCTRLRKNKGRVSKTGFFLRFWCAQKCPENCPDDSFCYIRPFFEESKNERKSPKNVKNWGVFAIFSCSKQPSAGIRLSSVKN